MQTENNSITVLFFASLKEQLDCGELNVELNNISTVRELVASLSNRNEKWQKALSNPNLLCAINQQMSQPTDILKTGDEVAFFPPVTGG